MAKSSGFVSLPQRFASVNTLSADIVGESWVYCGVSMMSSQGWFVVVSKAADLCPESAPVTCSAAQNSARK